MKRSLFLIAYVLILGSVYGQNLLKDGDFEEDDPNKYWSCSGNCKMIPVTDDKISGKSAIKITGRTHIHQGPSQSVKLARNARYHVVWYIKQLNSIPGKLFQYFRVSSSYHINDNTHLYSDFVRHYRIYPGRGWVKLEGYMKTPDRSFISSTLYMHMVDLGVDFLVDAANLTFVEEETNWKENANKRIEKIRKSNINFRLDVPLNTDLSKYKVEIKMTKHAFKFGSEVRDDLMTAPKYEHFRELFYYMFNYATMATYFWQWSYGPRESPDYSGSDKALDVLRQHGIPARGHNLFWGKTKFMPKWTFNLTDDQLWKEMETRVHYVLNVTKGKLESWDINNEMVHGTYFEDVFNDPLYSQKIFKLVHQVDPSVKLFLNDYQVVANGTSVSPYIDQVKDFKKANIPIYALGVQSHFDQYREPDPTMTLRRLDQLSAAGLPIWITELDVVADDENRRREWYERLYRIYFSHPSIEAIILWGFWGPKHWIGDKAALVSGKDYTINAAGQGYLDLVKKEWNTHVTRKLSDGKNFIVRGFHGDYDVIVSYDNSPIHLEKFSLGKQDKNVNIVVTDIHATVTIPVTSSPLIFHKPSVHHRIVEHSSYSMTRATSGDSSTMTCINQLSGFSVMGDNQHIDISCPQGYVMTGCSSMTKALTAKSDGASINTEYGLACRAWDGGGPNDYNSPVRAIARCCKTTGLHCDYRATIKPSRSEFDAITETKCPGDMFATGCLGHHWSRNMDGVYPTTHSCLAQNEDDIGGIYSYAICCSAPRMTCRVKKATFISGHKIGDASVVECDAGWSMTGCHAVSEDGAVTGSFIEGTKCKAINGETKTPGMEGSVAYATCCKTT